MKKFILSVKHYLCAANYQKINNYIQKNYEKVHS